MFKLHKPQLSGSTHSGHFMVSRLDDDEDDNNDPADDSSESERDNVEIDINNPESAVDTSSYRVESPKEEHLTSWNDLDRPAKHSHHLTYYNSELNQLHQHHHLQDHQAHLHQHAVTIDTSLTKLLECMSLYYSSKLTSPKWKSFKGLKLRLKYKIRLNNLIWRAWFLQYIRGRRPPGCQFTAPVETDVHKKSETIVLEGKYWKRKEKAILDEYKKWRTFHRQKSHMNCFRPVSSSTMHCKMLYISLSLSHHICRHRSIQQ